MFVSTQISLVDGDAPLESTADELAAAILAAVGGTATDTATVTVTATSSGTAGAALASDAGA